MKQTLAQHSLEEVLRVHIEERILPRDRAVLRNLHDIYELQLAYYENSLLSDDELVQRGGYFERVGDRLTHHYLMCAGESLRLSDHSSSRLKSFFEKNIFRTGYATHGLFPYRGKFHPQMIKGLLNAMGLKPGNVVLDPMMGSGTVPIEAAAMGIDSIGVDSSPFCKFMAQTKYDTLTMPFIEGLHSADSAEDVFGFFDAHNERYRTAPREPAELRLSKIEEAFRAEMRQWRMEHGDSGWRSDAGRRKTCAFLLLAYLDTAGYAQRSARSTPLDKFRGILDRYLFVADKFRSVRNTLQLNIGESKLMTGDARRLPIGDSSVDGVIFSPPYSFAIDYVANDLLHLEYLGVDVTQLSTDMVGLRGRNLREKYELYRIDMRAILTECSRVLKPGSICTVIIGTNVNQLSKVTGRPAEEVPGLHELIVEMAAGCGMRLITAIPRPIMGISNTLRHEYILMMLRQ